MRNFYKVKISVTRHMVLVHAFGVRRASGSLQGNLLLKINFQRSNFGLAGRESNPIRTGVNLRYNQRQWRVAKW